MSNETCNTSKKSKIKYESYLDVPLYRKQSVFWILLATGFMIFLLSFTLSHGVIAGTIVTEIPLILLVFGDIYYKSGNKVKSFGLPFRILAGIGIFFLPSLLFSLANALTDPNFKF